jgi:hypothetical protein
MSAAMRYLVAVYAVALCLGVLVPHPALYAIDESQDVEASFQLFNQQWMEHLYSREEKSKSNIACKKVDDSFVAEYTGYSRTYSGRTKKTASKETPYVGILNYQEQTFVSKAKTYEEAVNGQFKLQQECPVTEIFSFSRGKWRY